MSDNNISKVLIITGSLRSPSFTYALSLCISNKLEELEISSVIWDGRTRPVPLADPRFHNRPDAHEDENVRSLVKFANNAAAIVLATPIYHNGPSGALKNLMDHLTIQQFKNKPVGLVSHGGARSTQAVEQLRVNVRGLLGHSIITQVCTDKVDYTIESKDDVPILSSMTILRRVDRFVHELSVMLQVMEIARKVLD